ncbi:MAG: hypothetical protein PHV18_05115 [Lachnospiraceae bacterium]|nr:hypothetical protein [Lachnospiraceae bacterium]
MVNEIMDAVTRRLDELFGDGYEIYTDAVEQGLSEPCFFVSVLEPSRKPMLGRRSFQETGFCIQYIPEEAKPEKNRELNRAVDILFDGMEYIAMADGDLIRGTGRSYRIEDGVLNFFVSYNMFLVASAEVADAMEELKWKGDAGIGRKEKQ